MDKVLKLYKDAEIKTLPVDLSRLCEVLDVGFSTYGDYSALKGISHEEICQNFYSDGFTVSGKGKKIIVYNERQTNLLRRRFTIAHELAHIILGHLNTNIEQDGILNERMADSLAAEILCPLPVLHLLGVSSPEEISKICGVSYSAAEKAFSKLRHKRQIRDLCKDSIEIEITTQFLEFISLSHCKMYDSATSLTTMPSKAQIIKI